MFHNMPLHIPHKEGASTTSSIAYSAYMWLHIPHKEGASTTETWTN